MEPFEIIEILRTYCTTNNILFLPGGKSYANALADRKIYADFDLILVSDFNVYPTFAGGRVVSNRTNGLLMLGRKRESKSAGTPPVIVSKSASSLDETWEQKYDNRLRDLSNLLVTLLGTIACENDFELQNVNFKLDLNQLDLNVDFVACTLDLIK